MTRAQSADASNGNGDLWVAVGVVVVLGGLAFGLGGLYRDAPVQVVDASKLRGERLDAPRSVTGSGEVAGPATQAAMGTGIPIISLEKVAGVYQTVTFDQLAGYLYEDPNLSSSLFSMTETSKPVGNKIPAPILELDKTKIVVQGFMYPLKVEKGEVTAFWLLRNQTLCCFGQFPRLNELVFVTMPPGKSTELYNDQIVTVYGQIDVGEQKNKDGYVTSLYRLATDRVEGPLDL